MFSNSLNNAFGIEFPNQTKMTIWKSVKKHKTEGSSLYQNRDRSGCWKTKRAQGNISFLQEKLIEDPKISVRKNGLNISKKQNH